MHTTTWFITGCSSGIGRCVTEHLLRDGHRVAATARKPEQLADLAERYSDQLWVAALDVSDRHGVRTTVDRAFAELGRIDIVFSNAGYGLIGAAEELTEADIDRQLDTNLGGPIHLTRAVLPHFRAQGGGRILQTSSVGGQVVFPGSSAYHAAKWGVEGFFETVAGEVAEFGIGVTLVEPGSVPTSFLGSSLAVAAPMPEYGSGPVEDLRRLVTERGSTDSTPVCDVEKVADAIIASTAGPAPLRLTLGTDAYQAIHGALSNRLAALDAQHAMASSTDTRERRAGTCANALDSSKSMRRCGDRS
ncbi:MAG TPA: SDR family oxidoreductase [Pseudonocardiaceae bacterium]|jgi:NAD(P)-dependent dehydrogenase (short-subunit alcohol dehydrogenase family)